MIDRTIKTIAAACLSIACSAPLAAQDVATATVAYRDINLASSEGAAMLAHRVDRATTVVCGSEDTRDLARKAMFARCRREARAAAETQIAAAVDHAQRLAAKDGSLKVASR